MGKPEADAEVAKTSGNEAFKNKQYAEAIKFFSQAITLQPEDVAFYSNRSAAYLKNGDKELALADADKCLALQPTWSKGHARRGAALFSMEKYAEAVEIYTKGVEIDPENASLVEGLTTSQQALASGGKKKKKKKGKKSASAEGAAADAEAVATDKKSYVIGIDLGTTYSCVGVWENDGVTIIENRDGQKTIPSYVSFDPNTGQRSVGHAAKNQSVRFPNNTIYDVKRVIGQRFTDNGVESDVSKMQYKMVSGEEGKPMIQVEIKGETKSFSPEEVSAMVLTHCKEIAEKYLGVEITRAVVTVPAYFNDSQRNATKAAGRIAGLDVLRIINEPTAAALSYGLDNKIKEGKAMNVLIFDLGGGTFDVSILTIEGGIFTVKATGGDTRLGGEDFDNNLVDHLLYEIDKQGLPDPKGDARSMMRLRKAAETAKREVSVSASAEIRLDAFMDKKDFKVKVTREKFEQLNKGQFILCIDTVKRVLKDAKLKPGDIDEIVLVGGSTRIPKLQEMLVSHFEGKALCKTLNPDEAVAYGAAIQGAILCGTRNSKTDSLLLMDVTPLSLGIEIVGSVMSVVIPRNTPIPCTKTQTYTTERDNQTSDVVSVYEGERLRATENNLLGEFTIEGIEKAKKGEPQINVTFAIDSNGILNVTAMDQKTKCKAEISIANRSRATTEEIDKMVAEAAKYKAEDQERLAKVEAKNGLEEAIYTALDLSKSLDDTKLAGILFEAANKDQAWLDANFEDSKASEINLRRRALSRRMEGKK